MNRTRMTTWKIARPPNYNTNINHIYPYSEVPYIGEYNLIRLPLSSTNLIDHVDYWGEGKIESEAGISGFANCYNVNHQYQLVSNGPDRDRKIPNRIPVISYTNCNTSSYIKDSSVKLVTLMGAPINKSCAEDITRMVDDEIGKVVVFGFEENQPDIKNLKEELQLKGLLHCHGYEVSEKLQGLTLFGENSHRAYINLTEIGEELLKRIVSGIYESAINISVILEESSNGNIITNIVRKLLEKGTKTVMQYAFKLSSTSSEILTNHFPIAFKLIFKGGSVKIMNKKNLKTIKLGTLVNTDKSDRFACGDSEDKTSKSVQWVIYPIWEDKSLFFKLKNVEHNLFLKTKDTANVLGNRKIIGAENSNEFEYQWALEPLKQDDDLVFHIVNRKYNQWCTVDSSSESYLCASSTGNDIPDDFKWFIAPSQ